MKKGQKPSRHVRKVRTKKGRRRVVVNRKVKKKVKRKKKNYGSFKSSVEVIDDLEKKNVSDMTDNELNLVINSRNTFHTASKSKIYDASLELFKRQRAHLTNKRVKR